MNIVGFYKKLRLVERDGLYFVVNGEKRKILFKGSEEECSKMFVMLIADFINEYGEIV